MLIKMAIADAYAIAWEFTDKQTAPNNLCGYHQHPTYSALAPGSYTDDTQRAIANAHVLLSGEENWFKPCAYVQSYLAEFHRDPREGWSRRFQAYLQEHKESTSDAFMRGIRRRATNGALMGAAPLGFLPDPNSVRLAATMQTVSTHAGATAPFTQCVALAAHYFLFDLGPRSDLVDFISEEVEWGHESDRDFIISRMTMTPPKPAMPARSIAAGALWAVTNIQTLPEIITWAVQSGGDTDSLAAVAVAIASCSKEIDQNLPAALENALETEKQRTMLRRLNTALYAMADLAE